jgi:hypothetical protein
VSGSALAYERDPRVEVYIRRLPAWQQEICQRLRDLIHSSDPEVVETIKRTVQPYFVLEGNVPDRGTDDPLCSTESRRYCGSPAST